MKAALTDVGFDVVTETDMRALLWRHGGKRIRPCVIFGVCHPTLAHRAARLDPDATSLLLCNVAIYAVEDGGWTVVRATDPASTLTSYDPSLESIANELSARLTDALTRVADYAAPARGLALVEEEIDLAEEIC
jgi:uncharacterized protein (DUF302 family)